MATRRTLFWVTFLGAAGLLAAIPEFFGSAPDEEVEPVVRTASRAEPTAAAAPPGLEPVSIESAARNVAPAADLFAAHSWYVPPPPPPPAPTVVAPPPPPPSAPALPFQFLGKLHDGDSLRVFLQRGERLYTVAVGDVIDGTYRVEAIAGSQMTFVYLPLNIAQTLSVGSAL